MGPTLTSVFLGPLVMKNQKSKGGEPLLGLFSRPKRGGKRFPWPWLLGVRGGCLGVGVGLCWWFKLVLSFGRLPFFFWCPWFCSRGGACTTSSHHFPVVSPGGGASPVAPSPPHTLPAQNICHRLVSSTNLALSDKSHLFHSRGAHFPPRLKMRKAVGVILSRSG